MEKQNGISIGIKRIEDTFFIKMKLVGKLTDEDYKTITPMIETSLNSVEYPDISLLVDATQFEGWSLETAFDDLKLGLKHNEDFKKVAFVGNKKWQEYGIKLTNWFMSGKMEYFENISEAIDWLHYQEQTEEQTQEQKKEIPVDAAMTEKEIESRKEDIEKELEALFKSNMKITDWNVPESDDQKAAELIVEIFETKLSKIKEQVKNGEYKYF